MPFGISLGGSSSKQSSTGTFNRTSTPIVPDWMSGQTQDLSRKITDLGNIDPYSLINPADPLEARAGAVAGGLTGSPWNFDAAADGTRSVMNAGAPSVTAASLLENLTGYVNPMLEGVVDTTKADLEAQAGKTRAQQTLNMANQSAFGDSGAALARALTEGEITRGIGSTLSGLRMGAYDRAYGYSDADASRRQSASSQNASLEADALNRRLAASRQLGDLSALFDSTQRDNIATQMGVGGTFRGIADDEAQAPLQLLQTQIALQQGLPYELFVGQNEYGTETQKGKSSGFNFGVSAGK